jgi:hypothetical protein
MPDYFLCRDTVASEKVARKTPTPLKIKTLFHGSESLEKIPVGEGQRKLRRN